MAGGGRFSRRSRGAADSSPNEVDDMQRGHDASTTDEKSSLASSSNLRYLAL